MIAYILIPIAIAVPSFVAWLFRHPDSTWR